MVDKKQTFPYFKEAFANLTKEILKLMEQSFWHPEVTPEDFQSKIEEFNTLLEECRVVFNKWHIQAVQDEKDSAERFKKLVKDIKAYNKEHPIRVFYVHRWSTGELSPYCVEGPEYKWTTGSIWPGSMFYAPESDQEGPLQPAYVHVSAYNGRDALRQAQQMPEWEWKPKGPSKYEEAIDILRKKNPNLQVIAV
jgi:hypothetical protein